MSTGLFTIREREGGPRKGYIPKNRRGSRDLINRFAARLAEGMSSAAAARHLGISQQRGSQLFAQIRRELGWQAQ